VEVKIRFPFFVVRNYSMHETPTGKSASANCAVIDKQDRFSAHTGQENWLGFSPEESECREE